jgi:hypothetical protein
VDCLEGVGEKALAMSSFLLKRVPEGDRRRSDDIRRVVHELEALSENKTWKVSVEEYKAERSNPQNNYYWGVVIEMICSETGFEGEEMHEYLCGLRWGWKDKRVPKTPRNPEGLESIPRRTTTTNEDGKRSVLNKIQFEEFIDFARRFAATKLDLFIPDPDPNYLPHRERKEQAA